MTRLWCTTGNQAPVVHHNFVGRSAPRRRPFRATTSTRSAPRPRADPAYSLGVIRVATVNVNGIRAAQRRGFESWLARRDCDVIALQEVRCPVAALPEGVFGDYHLSYDPGELAGRNGVAVLTRHPPRAVRTWGVEAFRRAPDEATPGCREGLPGVGADEATSSWQLLPENPPRVRLARELAAFARHGRYIEVDLADIPLTVASLYLPKGGLPAHLQRPGRTREAPDGGARYERKMAFMRGFARQVTAARRAARTAGREFLLLGDLNIAHTALDVVDWRRQVRVEGFLPEERAWLDGIIGPRRFVDVVRALHPDVQGPYAWWSWLGRSFEDDRGWRIDYHLATPGLARRAVTAEVDREPSRAERMSDHAPVVVDYRL